MNDGATIDHGRAKTLECYRCYIQANQIYIESVTDMTDPKQVNGINSSNNKNVSYIRKEESTSCTASKEHSKWSIFNKCTIRNHRSGWLDKGNVRTLLSPGREQNHSPKGRRLR
jgi:hypothetical protein